jgi:hypothetical protein
MPYAGGLASEMTLFQLDEALCQLMESAAEVAAANNGEIPGELRDAVLDYCEAFGQKVDNIANYIKSLENDVRSAAAEVERLQSRRSAAENRIERLKGLLKYFMETRNLLRMKGHLNTISLRRNSQDSLIVDRPDLIPPEYWRVTFTVGLTELKELVSYLPEGHPLRVRVSQDGNCSMRREPDHAKMRSALSSGVLIQGAELRRGQHVRLC